MSDRITSSIELELVTSPTNDLMFKLPLNFSQIQEDIAKVNLFGVDDNTNTEIMYQLTSSRRHIGTVLFKNNTLYNIMSCIRFNSEEGGGGGV